MSYDDKLIYKDLSYDITGILFKVHNNLGRYCNEQQYGDALEHLLKESGIHYKREQILPVAFEGEKPGRNKADFVNEEKIIVELKAKRLLEKDDYYQVQRYLHAFNKKLGLLINFRDKYLKVKRILNSQGSVTRNL